MVVDDDCAMHPEANAFLAALRARDRSVNTERVYAGRVALYLSYCAAAGVDWRAPSLEALSRFLRHLVTEPLHQRGRPTSAPRYRSKATANAVMTAVCELLRFGAGHQWVTPEVTAALSEPKFLAYVPPGFETDQRGPRRDNHGRAPRFGVPRSRSALLSDDQLLQLLAAVETARDRFLVALLAVTGVRIAEALALRCGDVHLPSAMESSCCRVHRAHVNVRSRIDATGALAASRHPRTITISDEVVGLYADYQNERSRCGAGASGMVFVNVGDPLLGQPMTYVSAKGVFDRLSKQLRYPVRPHLLRRTADEMWRRQGIASDVRQRLLGNVSGAPSARTTL